MAQVWLYSDDELHGTAHWLPSPNTDHDLSTNDSKVNQQQTLSLCWFWHSSTLQCYHICWSGSHVSISPVLAGYIFKYFDVNIFFQRFINFLTNN